MKVVTSDEIREIDRKAIEEAGIPGVVLMENAGRAVADTAKRLLEGMAGRRVCIFAGKGNNGGDGFVAARHLVNSQVRVKTFLIGKTDEVRGDARVNLDILMRMGVDVEEIGPEDVHRARVAVSVSDVVVDAIFGTGFRGEVGGYAAQIIDAINESGRPVVAVDVPSGLDASTGKISASCVRARYTVTFGLPKVGLLLYPGAACAGELVVADIGIPRAFLTDERLKLNLSIAEEIRRYLPARDPDSHKGTFGRVLVVAGSQGMAGAAALASLAALRSGAGLVTLAVPKSLQDIMHSRLTEVMTRALPETESGSVSLQAQALLDGILRGAEALAIGPGLSMHSETAQLVRNIVMTTSVPAVIDADGLNAIAQDPGTLKTSKAPIVLTPHPGEMARLTGLSVHEIKRDRLSVTMKAAAQWGKVVVLKGARTVIADPSGEAHINPTGNSGMATAGSGDVLTGLIAGLLAQGVSALEAAVLGTYVHGLAGDIAAARRGEMGMIAGDILECVPEALVRLAGLKGLAGERGETDVGGPARQAHRG
ncbi:MAG: ADP-dependent NAD(P)H-hydrate dehydratase / NAD(P)H-hydrate epimerase [Bacillota bacterium]|nr:ADP-dependent NAD(P)H-hydrate dehydratase / NAD(P)H-hydrate epimerase [Bacillota bacterium]